MRRYFIIGMFCCCFLSCFSLFAVYFEKKIRVKEQVRAAGDSLCSEVSPVKAAGLAAVLDLEVPFFSQAPKGDWSYPYQEACEEASCLLAANVFKKLELNTDSFDLELLKLIAWEKKRFGCYFHTTVEETALMLEEYFGLTAVIHTDPGLGEIARIISRGSLIIVPVAGKHLDNPYYINGGPVYHMMIIKGYHLKEKKIITNDVGTRRGADLMYDWTMFHKTIHDWHDEDILLGKKLIIEVRP